MGKGKSRVNPPSQLDLIKQILKLDAGAGTSASTGDAVLVCIDCEAFELSPKKITEIGVAVLDTRDVVDFTSSHTIEAWLSRVNYAHYRPVEYAHLENRRFIKGCANDFNFGSSTWIKLADASKLLSRIFKHPDQSRKAADFKTELSGPTRPVVIVGHDVKNETGFTSQLGFDLGGLRNVVQTIDTQKIAGGTKGNSIGLQRLLHGLGLAHVNLHNGGNDAAYTLQALLSMALKEAAVPGSISSGALKHTTKPPKPTYNKRMAPQVFGGTAQPGDIPEKEMFRSGIKEAWSAIDEAGKTKRDRKQHKRDVRAAQAGPGSQGSQASALGNVTQRPLPPPS